MHNAPNPTKTGKTKDAKMDTPSTTTSSATRFLSDQIFILVRVATPRKLQIVLARGIHTGMTMTTSVEWEANRNIKMMVPMPKKSIILMGMLPMPP